MLRSLFTVLLFAAASGAWAAEPMPADAEAPQCDKGQDQGNKAAAGSGGASSSARPGTPAPVRPRSPNGRSTPRWHSMLPGMIR